MIKVRILQIILLILALNLGFLIQWGSFHESVFDAFPRLFQEIWFKVTVFDLYLGILLFSLWVFIREPFWKASLLTLSFVFLGNFMTGLYVIWSLNSLTKEKKLSDWFVGE